ncbi:aspartate/glutamate racemase family protein [Propionibacteriaceae bacterium Y1700]|uniref:aspartate/glutamate racemase family protein n=1 Tax=Microlunatus sp. Y1700 TaxID=3418487 RepID=UPI003DA79D9B
MSELSTMRRIGLLGGMSWESTALYYRLLNEGVRDRLGGHHSADLVMRSVDFAEIVAQQESGDWAAAAAVLAEAARGVEAAGAQTLLICANTMHKVADDVAAAVGVPLLHIADVVAESLQRQQIDTVGLLATRYTMEDRFYADRLGAHKINTVVPDRGDREIVHRIIYSELVKGVITDASRQTMINIIDRLAQRGVGGVVLGCTEIELLISSADTELPVFPTTALHCTAALDLALSPA